MVLKRIIQNEAISPSLASNKVVYSHGLVAMMIMMMIMMVIDDDR